MKKIFALAMMMLIGVLTSCTAGGSCSGPQQLTFWSPWGRTEVSETSVYKVKATAPTDEELNSIYRTSFYVVSDDEAANTYTTSIRTEGSVLRVDNVFSFTGTYYDTNRNPIRRQGASGDESAAVTDHYTATATFNVVNEEGKELFRAIRSERTYEALTVPYFTEEGTFLRRGSVRITIEYGKTSATATLENLPLEGWEGEDYRSFDFGKDESGNPILTRTYTYGETDLVIDNELYLYFLRSLSANSAFSEQNVTPTQFKTIAPMNDVSGRNTAPYTKSYSVQTVTDLNVTFDDYTFADDPESSPTEKRPVIDGNGYAVSVVGSGGHTGSAIQYYIFRDGGDDNNAKETKVRYKKSDGSDSDTISLCRILQFDYSMNFRYTLSSYENRSPKIRA